MVAGQESWEKEDTKITVEGSRYKWFGKPRGNQSSQRGEGGVGFLVREFLVDEVEFISDVQCVWMKVRGRRGSSALYIGCVYMPTDCRNSASIEGCYEKLKEDVLSFKGWYYLRILMPGLVSRTMSLACLKRIHVILVDFFLE